MGYRWYNGRFLSDEEYNEEEFKAWSGCIGTVAFLLPVFFAGYVGYLVYGVPTMLFLGLIGGYIGIRFNEHFTKLAILVILLAVCGTLLWIMGFGDSFYGAYLGSSDAKDAIKFSSNGEIRKHLPDSVPFGGTKYQNAYRQTLKSELVGKSVIVRAGSEKEPEKQGSIVDVFGVTSDLTYEIKLEDGGVTFCKGLGLSLPSATRSMSK